MVTIALNDVKEKMNAAKAAADVEFEKTTGDKERAEEQKRGGVPRFSSHAHRYVRLECYESRRHGPSVASTCSCGTAHPQGLPSLEALDAASAAWKAVHILQRALARIMRVLRVYRSMRRS